MTAVADAVAAPPRSSVPVRHVAAAVVGNALSFYDFLTYSFFSIQIGHAFFPSHDRSASLLASLAVFGVGFVSRPIGSIIIGRMGDRVGRKPAMVLSFTLLGIAIVGLALTPSYAAIGMAAPVLAIAFRLLQGFALGGEVGPTTAYLLEAAPPERRGFYTSFQATTQDFAVCCAGFVGVALSHVLDGPTFDIYGWRIAFLIGALIVPFGFFIRRSMPETHNPLADTVQEPPGERIRYRRVIALCFLMLASATVASYVLSYMTTYAMDTLGLPAKIAFWATVVNGGVAVPFDMLGGWLSDRVGRKPVMIVCWALLLVCAIPSFAVMAAYHTAGALLGMTALLSALAAMGSTPIIIALTEGLPARVRSGAVAMTYAFAISIFGGSAQPIVKLLIVFMHNPIAPAWYLAVALAMGLVAMIVMHETAPAKA